MSTPTPEQLAKLPVWAEKYIRTLENEGEMARRNLNKFTDNSTESPIYVEEYNLGKRFIQARSVIAEWASVKVEIYLPRKDDAQRDFGPEIKWQSKHILGHVAMVPSHFQCVRLLAKENMR